jgi:hypothetical protein
MANTADTTKAGHFVQVMYSGTGADWAYTDMGFGSGAVKVKSIMWFPTATDDVLIINEGGIDGPSIVHAKAADDTDTLQFLFGDGGTWMKPYIDLTDCTFGTVTSTKIIFELA